MRVSATCILFIFAALNGLLKANELYDFEHHCTEDDGRLTCIDPFTGFDYELLTPNDGKTYTSKELFDTYIDNQIRARNERVARASSINRISRWTLRKGNIVFSNMRHWISNNRKGPRAICHVPWKDLCLSWALYDGNLLPNGANADTAGFASRCVQAGMTVDVVAATYNYSHFTCVTESESAKQVRCNGPSQSMSRPLGSQSCNKMQ